MSTSAPEALAPTATSVAVDDDEIVIELSDGRSVSVPLAWYPRLLHATKREREDFRLTGSGRGIHWPQIDEDISVESVLGGRPSMESPGSLKRWLQARGIKPA